LEFDRDIIVIIGHNGASVTPDGKYYLFFGGYSAAKEFNGVIVREDEVEMAINHEVLHCVLDSIGEDASTLDNIWFKYKVRHHPVLNECSELGIGF
jgi:hypothetical protein